MKNTLFGFCIVLIMGCTSKQVTQEATKPSKEARINLTVLHQSNRYGVLEPCGCHTNPYGGIDREANAIEQIKKAFKNVLYVDAGNMFVQLPMKGTVEYYRKRGEKVAEMVDLLGLQVFAPGPNDFVLGAEFLKGIAHKSHFKFVATNIVSEDRTPLFAPYQLETREGVVFGIVSATPVGSISVPGVKVLPPEEALTKTLKEIVPQTDFIILLSQLPSAENEVLASQFSDVRLIVGADPKFAVDRAFWLEGGRTLLVDTLNMGYRLGHVDLDLKLPFKGYYSPTAIDENKEQITYIEEQLKKNPSDDKLSKFLEALKKKSNLEIVAGGTSYFSEMLRLDPTRFGTPNEMTKLMKQLKEETRQSAVKKSKKKIN